MAINRKPSPPNRQVKAAHPTGLIAANLRDRKLSFNAVRLW